MISVLLLVNDQRDAQILFYVFISIYKSLHVSSTSCSSSGERNCINTASGNSHSMLVAEMCAGWKNTWSFTKNHYMIHGQQNVKLRSVVLSRASPQLYAEVPHRLQYLFVHHQLIVYRQGRSYSHEPIHFLVF